VATIAGGVIGVATIYSDSFVQIAGQPLTASIVTLSAMGALLMYTVAMAALFRLRAIEPHLVRPFRAPLYPFLPALALLMAAAALILMLVTNPIMALVFGALMALLVTGSLTYRRSDGN
jgi:ethanolamine permease